ncbi:MAG TPA: metal-sulfur cluster assembly factor [Methylomirabilota bacterium]|nr:metal-sulfur cluster assembly factor [Methylomirabilota bacterium]
MDTLSQLPLTHDSILDALKEVMDPELGCNIVDLGLVRAVELIGAQIEVSLTLTTPGCPMSVSIAEGVRNALFTFPEVEDVEIVLVWDPPWTPEQVTPAGRTALGWVS